MGISQDTPEGTWDRPDVVFQSVLLDRVVRIGLLKSKITQFYIGTRVSDVDLW